MRTQKIPKKAEYGTGPVRYQCPFCPYLSPNLTLIIAHYDFHHKLNMTETSNKLGREPRIIHF